MSLAVKSRLRAAGARPDRSSSSSRNSPGGQAMARPAPAHVAANNPHLGTDTKSELTRLENTSEIIQCRMLAWPAPAHVAANNPHLGTDTKSELTRLQNTSEIIKCRSLAQPAPAHAATEIPI
ncbi:hypothetical protein HGM15179_018356 [Zosterops borbonicus]|uniref:Uncharacterized protein n=1 Tax=Zosterops borbonicus TaxID=364589 RepID=A0A8K1LCA9_9PASS|nr:hypothetical protein HGM15179_018356 [Zosterops borbonicus]